LGQRCSFCHAAGDWPRDDKKEKLVAREMIDLVNGANARLQRVQGVQANTRIGCNTCHRGNAKPAP
jgi:photosynthetic reaction center cytochrome c subunit